MRVSFVTLGTHATYVMSRNFGTDRTRIFVIVFDKLVQWRGFRRHYLKG
jgi:hypothetical protein